MNKAVVLDRDATPKVIEPNRAFARFRESFEELLESLEYASPNFWKEIEASRRSGTVSAVAVKRRLGMK